MAKKTKSLIGGMTVLGITGIVCKVIGVLFSVPLTWIIGMKGMGVFQAVFPTYNLLLTVSSAGLPVAVSRMVSHSLAKDQPHDAKQVFKVALWMLTALGLICSILMLAFSNALAARVNVEQSAIGFKVIAPCVAIVCMLSAFRGFMQGQQDMVPTAISQLIEQVGKVFISLPLAYFGFQQGMHAGQLRAASLELVGEEADTMISAMAAGQGAAGALLGITLMEALALGYMAFLYFRRNAAFNALPALSASASISAAARGMELIRISIPITISACIVPLAQFIDSIMMIQRMQVAGLTEGLATELYGVFSGNVIRLINIPTALALAISMSLVPAISACRSVGDNEGAATQASTGIRFAFLIGLPCSIGMSLMAEPIVRLFYQGAYTNGTYEASYYYHQAGSLLQMSALTVVLFTVVQATSAILQGLGKQRIPMYTLVAGVGCKIVLNYVLVGTPGVDIHGGPIASIVCYSVSMVPNLIMCIRAIHMKFDWKGWLLLPGAATAAMGVVVWLLRQFLPITRVFTIVEIGVGMAVYVAAALAIGAVRKEDIAPLLRRRKRA